MATSENHDAARRIQAHQPQDGGTNGTWLVSHAPRSSRRFLNQSGVVLSHVVQLNDGSVYLANTLTLLDNGCRDFLDDVRDAANAGYEIADLPPSLLDELNALCGAGIARAGPPVSVLILRLKGVRPTQSIPVKPNPQTRNMHNGQSGIGTNQTKCAIRIFYELTPNANSSLHADVAH